MKVSGPLSYHVELLSGDVVRRHVDAVRKRVTSELPLPTSPPTAMDVEDLYQPSVPQIRPAIAEAARAPIQPLPIPAVPRRNNPPPVRWFTRYRPPPDRLSYSLRGGKCGKR